MGWYNSNNQHNNNRNNGHSGLDVFRWILYIVLAIVFIIVEMAAISSFGVLGIFVGPAVIVIIVCFFGVIFGNW